MSSLLMINDCFIKLNTSTYTFKSGVYFTKKGLYWCLSICDLK